MTEFTLKEKLRFAVLPRVITWLTRLWFGTVRVKILNKEIYDEYFLGNTGEEGIVAASWHRHAIFFFYFFRTLDNGAIMISKSKDGEITSRIAKRFGYTPVRGSSSRGGKDALQAMINYISEEKERRFCGTAVDGPRGPARKLKKGMLALAKETGAFFVPMACSGTHVYTFSKAWDKTILPLPFSKVVIAFHAPFKVPQNLSEEKMERLHQQTEDILNKLTDKVDKICGYKG
ncbi:MAG: lysophospholipid acyltransferase family protein [Thermodesulfobacteriota bacterium]|nr:lysophospholipid acyltransferase family protein [Thermodesulfobacteriota bacterium]